MGINEMSANHIASKNLLDMPGNSVAGIFMFTIIAFSFFNHGFCSISHNPISSKNMTTLQLTQNINTTISEMALMIHNNLSKNRSVNSSRVSLQVQVQLVSHYLETLKKNLELVSVHQMVTKKLEIAQSRILELENYQNDLKIQLADEKKNQYNIIKENNNLTSKLYESVEKISNITEDNVKLNNEYMKMKKSYSIDQEKTKLINDELNKEKENYKNLFDAKTLVDDKLSSLQLENEELKNKLSQLNDTFNKVSLDQSQTLAEYSEVNKKYNESSEILNNCENIVDTLIDQMVGLEKNLAIAKLNLTENEKTQSEMVAFKSNELEILNQTHLNMKLQLKNEIDLLKNTNEKLIQESNALKEINEKKLKVIENEYQLNLTNKQEVIKTLMIENSKRPSILELDDLMKTLISIMKYNEDDVPNDLMEKRHTLFAKHYDEKMTVMVNDIKRLFNDIAATSSSQFPNKYVCNKKTTYYDSNICTLLSRNADSSDIGIYQNNLTFLPRDIFTGLEKVKILLLYTNHLTNLEPGVFNGLFKCEELYLNENDLTTLSKYTFTSLIKLKALWLQSNQLNKLESGTFDGLFDLTTIYLSNNQLTYLPQDIFKDNNKLRWLYLENNKINTLSLEIFSKLRLTDLNIKNNCFNDSYIQILKKNISVENMFT